MNTPLGYSYIFGRKMRIFEFFGNLKTLLLFGDDLQVVFYATCANFDRKWVITQKQGVPEKREKCLLSVEI